MNAGNASVTSAQLAPSNEAALPPPATEDAGVTQTSEVVNEPVVAPRILAGLQPGRLVHYALKNGALRALLILSVVDPTGIINGVLFFGADDVPDLPVPLQSGPSGHVPEVLCIVRNIGFNDGVLLVPGTWQWPQRDAVVASGIDANALDTAVMAMVASERIVLLEELDARIKVITDTFNEKLQANLDAVNALLDSHSKLVADAVATIKDDITVINEHGEVVSGPPVPMRIQEAGDTASVPVPAEGGESAAVPQADGAGDASGKNVDLGALPESAQTGS